MKCTRKNSYHGHMRIVSSFNTAVLAVTLSLLLAACGGGAGGGIESNSSPASASSPDTTLPVITITAPTSGSSYTATSASVTLTGTATDNVGLSQISWTNSKGGSGSLSVSGTSASGSFIIPLLSGSNVITVTARDTSGNTGQRLLTVNYNPPPITTTSPTPTSTSPIPTSSPTKTPTPTATSTPVPTPITSNTAVLAWDAVVATNLSGYRLYYGTAPGTYLQPPGQGISVGNAATYTLMGLSSKTRYYFAVTAFDTSGNESGYSNETFKDIP